jgi:hypothetical protein
VSEVDLIRYLLTPVAVAAPVRVILLGDIFELLRSSSWKDVASFVPVAQNASVCEVLQSGQPAMLAADYMVDLMRETGVVFHGSDSIRNGGSRAGILQP